MGVSDLNNDTNAVPVVDLSARGMQKLDPNFICSDDTHTLILDRNQIMKLEHLERSPGLQQLSVANNRLVRMMGVSRLTELKVLNLPNNSIGYIEGLRDLPNLNWLNLSGNNIKVIEQLNHCVSLQHLDLSDNNISSIGDLTKLVSLKTLLLHGNSITTLRTVPAHLPVHVSILSLAENEIRDLNEMTYLSPLHELQQLSIMSNPCVMATPSLPGFDYRPYVMSWCLSLKVLDGYVVSQKEGLKAEWLYSQGKGRSYRPGQHVQLVQYLATVCPLTSSPALVTAEDAKLERILNKQRFHQMQLLEETGGGCPSPPPRPTQLDVDKNSPLHTSPQGGATEMQKTSAGSPAAVTSDKETEPVVQINTWMTCDSHHLSLPAACSPTCGEELLCLEDVQTSEDNINSSVLSSESVFLPVTSDLEPHPALSDSEDETVTFEPDSLAAKRPAQPHSPGDADKVPASAAADEQTRETEEQVVCCETTVTAGSPVARGSPPQCEAETSSHCEDTHEEESAGRVAKSDSLETERAAVKIQAWWRGQHTRRCNPMAREVRSEIRLRRMQDHIVFLSGKLDRVEKQYEEERLQRLVQEDAVKFLWNQLQSVQQWKQTVEQQLAGVGLAVAPVQSSATSLCDVAPPVSCSTTNPAATDGSFPDSGFQSTCEQAAQENSFLSSGTADSLKTVRALSPVHISFLSGENGVDSTDCSLLDQYLCSVQQRDQEAEEAEEGNSDRTDTPLPSSPPSPGTTAQSDSLPVRTEDNHLSQ